MTDGDTRHTLVFLHGWTMEGRIFDDTVQRLADRFDCHAPDLPGHGAESNGFPPTVDGAADFVADYLTRNEILRPVLVGWSLGAMVAWNLTRRHSDVALAGIAAIDMSAKIVNGPHWHLGIRNFEARQNEKALNAMKADWQAYALRINAGMYAADSQQPHPETLAIIRRKDPDAMAAMWSSLTEADERDTIGLLPCQLLVMKGEKSRLYAPETGRYLADRAPSAELVRFDHSGHSPHLEEAERFADVLAQWAERLPRP